MEHPLRAYRRKAGITLEQLGATVGASKGFLSKVEKGLQTPSLKLAMRISEATQDEVGPADLVSKSEAISGDAA